MRLIWLNIKWYWVTLFLIPLAWERLQIRLAQYGDVHYGEEIRREELAGRAWRRDMAARSRGPMHAGYVWE